MNELKKMVETKPLLISKNIDPRIQNLLKKILRKNSWERLSCQQILQDSNFRSLIIQFNLAPKKNKSQNKKNKFMK